MKAKRSIALVSISILIAILLTPWVFAQSTDTVAAIAAGTSVHSVSGGSYSPDLANVRAGYDPFLGGTEWRGTMEFVVSNYTSSVVAATLKLVVSAQLAASNYWYRVYAFSSAGNGEVNGFDFTNIMPSAIGTLYSNALPVVDATNIVDVTASFNKAVSNGWIYFGLHTVQTPDQTTGSKLQHYSFGAGQPVLMIVRQGGEPPPAPPAAPLGLTASDGFMNRIEVGWLSVSNASQYVVYRNTSPDSGAASILDRPVANSYTDTTALAGLDYYYWVRATNVSGISPFSSNVVGKLLQQVTLEIHSAYGATVPPAGAAMYRKGSNLVCMVTNSPVTAGWTQYVCAGWTMTGNSPGSGGTTNTGAFSLTNNGVLTWRWTTNVYLSLLTNGNGEVRGAASGWRSFGSSVTVTAVPAAQFTFAGWSGAVAASRTNENPLAVTSDVARAITARFVPAETGVVTGTRYVDLNNVSPSWPYASWPAAATAIQDAVDAALPGETVLVSNGTYALSKEILITNNLVLRSVNGATDTIVDAAYNGSRCFNINKCYATLDGFTVTRGFHYLNGGGIYCASGHVRNCIIVNNVVSNQFALGGAGIYCEGSWIEACVISSNRCSAGGGGGGVRATGSKVERCDVHHNFADAYAGGVWAMDNSLVVNCVIYTNRVNYCGGGVVTRYTGNVVRNCTISDNFAGGYGGGIYCWNGGTFEDCIIYYNNFENFYLEFETATWKSSCVTPSPNPVCITNAPLFVNKAGFDYRLLSNSPCIDAGAMVPVADDRVGMERPLDGNADGIAAWDMGAYEFLNGLADSDGDWLRDTNELAMGTRLTSGDTDGDHTGDGAEVLAGTDPLDSNSFFAIHGPPDGSIPTRVVIRWLSVAGKRYCLERATDIMAQTAFTNLECNLLGLEGYTTYTDTTANSLSPCLYRIKLDP